MKIARVFLSKTSMCPQDKDVYFDAPDMFTPRYDEVHISVVFTWDIPRVRLLKEAWMRVSNNVKVGGVAIDGETDQPFQPGLYLKHGITITSRGCPNRCGFCMVRHGLIEFDDFSEGSIVQDNNILACSDRHKDAVFKMLRHQKRVEFKGGLDKHRITPKIAEALRSLSIRTLWLAYDQPGAIKPLKKAVDILKKVGFTRNHLYCYCLIGKNMSEEEGRLREVWDIGCTPFAQLYRNPKNDIQYSREWKQFARSWSRPAVIRSIMKHRGASL